VLIESTEPTRDTHKIAIKSMMVASCEVNLQSKHDLICHMAKVKAATPAHSMAMQFLYSIFVIPQNRFPG